MLFVIALALVGGPWLATTAFPEASLLQHLLGGWVLGGFFTICAVPERLLDL